MLKLGKEPLLRETTVYKGCQQAGKRDEKKVILLGLPGGKQEKEVEKHEIPKNMDTILI